MISALTPYGYYEYKEKLGMLEMERRLPDLLRDIAEYANFGLPVSQSIVKAGGNDYGRISEIVRNMAKKISSGVPVEEAIESEEKNLKSKAIKRALIVLRKATQSGNNISEVLRLVSEFSGEMEVIREGRISEMKNFVLVMYVAFAVFFFVVIIIDIEFLGKISHGSFTTLGIASVALIKIIFSIGILVQGGSTGFMSGILRDGSIGTGSFLAGVTLLLSVVILAIFGVI
ncbi:MAG: type II secretion system F family protein [Thermoplasmataceae archaeon]